MAAINALDTERKKNMARRETVTKGLNEKRDNETHM